MDDQRDYAEEAANRALMHEEEIAESSVDTDKIDMLREMVDSAPMQRLVASLIRIAGNYEGTLQGKFVDVSSKSYKVDITFANMHLLTSYVYAITDTYGFDSDIVGNAHSIHESVTLGITVLKLY